MSASRKSWFSAPPAREAKRPKCLRGVRDHMNLDPPTQSRSGLAFGYQPSLVKSTSAPSYEVSAPVVKHPEECGWSWASLLVTANSSKRPQHGVDNSRRTPLIAGTHFTRDRFL